jgi:uncharacterized protein YcnI
MRSTRVLPVGLAAAAILMLTAVPAFAHVTVNPSEAEKGGFTKLTIQVPNEETNTNTVKVDVKFPTDHPIASVSVKPKPGWTYQATTAPLATPITTDDGTLTEAVSEIVWSGGTIKPGEFDEFEVSVGPLPDDVDSLTFPTIQSYDNGQDVSWIQDTVEGQPEPDRPAPVLKLTAAESPQSSSSSGSASSSTSPTVAVVKKESSNGLAVAALIVGGIALIVGIVAIAIGRRRTA